MRNKKEVINISEAVEFEVLSDLTPISTALIETNAEAVKLWLANAVAPYASLVVTEDAIADAKAKRADIRKLRTAIDSQRKAVKKSVLAPYERFERSCKELDAILAEGDSNIDVQVKAIENERREAKISVLREFFNENVGALSDYLKWEDVFNSRWGNVGYSEGTAKQDITEFITRTENDLEVIRGLESPFETTLLEEYAASHDLRSVLAKNNALKARQEAEERTKAETASLHAPSPESAVERNVEPPERKTDAHEPYNVAFLRPMVEDDKPKLYHLEFAVEVTMAQAHALKRFFRENDIDYKKIGGM